MKVIGLTGNIGSGKSTVGRMLKDFGAAVIDCDAVSRQLTTPGAPCLQQIIGRWGRGYLLPDGSLDRKKMAANIFVLCVKIVSIEKLLEE